MSSFLADDQNPIFYSDTGGQKPAIIFIHGWTSAGSHWVGITTALRRWYRCIAIDLRGHGRTPGQGELTISRLAKDLHQLIEHLKLEKPTIVGWSMGGLTTFEYARQFGVSQLKSIVLVDQTPCMQTSTEWTMGLFGAYTPDHITSMRQLFESQQRRVLRRFAMGVVHPNRTLLRFATWLTSPYRRNYDRKALLPLAEDMADRDYRDLLASMDVPILLCYGSQSWLYPGKVGEYLQEHLPQSTLVHFERSGHCPPFEEPVKFVRTLYQFMHQQLPTNA